MKNLLTDVAIALKVLADKRKKIYCHILLTFQNAVDVEWLTHCM